ncbi:Immune-associated nucleotide-binding protein 10 [Bulinus truncatus]|nr:Immune-associated nucleotide-binding protein 10 [Bulinus truncatus]
MATSDAMRANPEGFHALLLVVRFGRFTKEDRDTVEFLKKIFGQNSVRKHCILVITCGDEFERESEETGETFEEWCAAQTGVFQDLLEECGHRVVLFENKTKDERKKDRQLKGLMQMVDRLDNLYSDDEFTRAINGRTRLLIEARKLSISEHTRAEINKIRSQLEQFQPRKKKNEQMCQLDVFYLRAEEVLETVQAKDANFGILQDVIEDAKLLNCIVLKYSFTIIYYILHITCTSKYRNTKYNWLKMYTFLFIGKNVYSLSENVNPITIFRMIELVYFFFFFGMHLSIRQ